jgi:hypothetical protein
MLQERMTSLANNGVGAANTEKQLSVAPYWFQYDPGDGTAAPSIPPSGGMGVSTALLPASGTGGVLVGVQERTFYMTSTNWTDWPLAAPSKHSLVPRMCGKLASGAILSGECLDTRLAVRWVSVP